MNWLAHLVLSEPRTDFRIGNLLPDFVPAAQLLDLPDAVAQGVVRHRQIDAYTDAHPIACRTAQRFSPPLRRFGKVLADVFYDHFLARQWKDYASVPLTDFLETFHQEAKAHFPQLSGEACQSLEMLRRYNWMASYGDLDGIEGVLYRMGRRLRRPVDLVPAMAVLRRDYHEFEADFQEFFPNIRDSVAPNLEFPLIR